jgi:hypothetical protein
VGLKRLVFVNHSAPLGLIPSQRPWFTAHQQPSPHPEEAPGQTNDSEEEAEKRPHQSLLFSLPTELHSVIAPFLGFQDRLQLSLTCKGASDPRGCAYRAFERLRVGSLIEHERRGRRGETNIMCGLAQQTERRAPEATRWGLWCCQGIKIAIQCAHITVLRGQKYAERSRSPPERLYAESTHLPKNCHSGLNCAIKCLGTSGCCHQRNNLEQRRRTFQCGTFKLTSRTKELPDAGERIRSSCGCDRFSTAGATVPSRGRGLKVSTFHLVWRP